MNKLRKASLGAVAALAVMLAGCAGGGGEAAPDNGNANGNGGEVPTVRLGALLPQTGDLAALGASTLEAAELAVEIANESDEIVVELEVQDSGTDPAIGQTAIQTLIGQGVVGIVGDVSTTVCLSVIDIAAQSQTPMIGVACTSPQLTDYPDDGYFYRTSTSSAEQGRALANLVWDDGHETAAIIGVNDNYGQPIVSTFVEAFEGLGGTIEANVAYDPAGRTFVAEAQRLAATNATAMVLIGLEDTSAAIVNDAAQRGLMDRAWYMGDGFRSEEFPSLALPGDPAALYEWKGIGTGSADGVANDAFNEQFQTRLNKGPGSFAAQAYDATWILILAGARAELNGTEVVDEIAAVTDPSAQACIAEECIAPVVAGDNVAYNGATGAVEFDDNGNPVRAYYEVWQFSADGIVSLETIEVGQ